MRRYRTPLFRHQAVFLFSALGLAGFCRGDGPPAAVLPAFDLNVVSKAFREEVRRQPSLHGAWLDVDYIDDPTFNTMGTFKIRRVVDASRAVPQRAELKRLIQRWIPAGNYTVDVDDVYPFSRLLADVETEIETDPALMGCQLLDAWYDDDPNQADPTRLLLRFNGRIFREGQDATIGALAARIMRHNPIWLKHGEEGTEAVGLPTLLVTPDSKFLEIVEPVESLGRFAYAAGMRHFGARNYSRAAASFHQATIESPRKLQYYYWWTLSDLAQGRYDLAQRRMHVIVDRFREEDFDHQSAEYRLVVRSLERVQGPLRQTLLQLEARAIYGRPKLLASY